MKLINLFTRQLCLLLLCLNVNAQRNGPPLDVVVCVDLSGSTTGMTERLKESLFEISNSLVNTKPAPELRIALVAYGRPGYLSANSFVKVYSDLTSNLDSIELILLKIIPFVEKGDQLVGAAINTCVQELNWSKEKNAVKLVCLVGNGLVTLGPVPYLTACENARKKKINIHTFYGITPTYSRDIGGWKIISDITGGDQYEFEIPKQTQLFYAGTKNEIINLNNQLNKTYIYYDEAGHVAYNRIIKLDSILLSLTGSCFESWLRYKSSEAFQKEIANWDLVCYSHRASFDIMQINRDALPETYQDYTGAEMVKIFKNNFTERQKLNASISKMLSAEPTYKDEKIKKLAEADDENQFGKTLIQAILKSLSKQGFNISANTTGSIK